MSRRVKRAGIIASGLVIGIIVAMQLNKEQEEFSSFTTISNGQVVSAYVNGENVIDERRELEEKVKESVGEYYEREVDELVFKGFCMLEMEGITVEVEVDGVWYMVECDMDGEIVK
ncbi:MAG: hypothetical protein R3Y58_04955 [Eubacteriales bacterium]